MRLVKLERNSIARKWQLGMHAAWVRMRRLFFRSERIGLHLEWTRNTDRPAGFVPLLPPLDGPTLRPARKSDMRRRSHGRP